MGAKRIISCMITYEIANGYSTKLKDIVNEENVRVCKLKEDGSIDGELDKDQYFVSNSIIYLPLYLNKEEKVLINYDKESDAEWVYISSSSYPSYTSTGTSTSFGSWTL